MKHGYTLSSERLPADIISLFREANEASLASYVPYSRQSCGAAVLFASGNTYKGCTVDNSSFPTGTCAVQNALNTAVSEESRWFERCGDDKANGPEGIVNGSVGFVNGLHAASMDIRAIAVYGYRPGQFAVPCGRCRQILVEFGLHFDVFLIKKGEQDEYERSDPSYHYIQTSPIELLPLATSTSISFSPKFNATVGAVSYECKKLILASDVPSLASKVLLPSPADPVVDNLDATGLMTLCAAAIGACRNAYTPYLHFPVGAAILVEDDKGATIITGVNVMNGSFGMGLCAERCAYSKFVLANGRAGLKCKIKALAVICLKMGEISRPCGSCCQFSIEFGKFPVYCLANMGGAVYAYDVVNNTQMLPGCFSLEK